jgi:hypothetical protein
VLKPPPHIQQIEIGYCLPACAQMALAQFEMQFTQTQLAKVLETRPGVGTPFSNLKLLSRLKIRGDLQSFASIENLNSALNANQSVIVPVTTSSGLPGWGNIRTQHSLLILNLDPNRITYHDPALQSGPVSVALNEFLLAWSEMDQQAAFLKLPE